MPQNLIHSASRSLSLLLALLAVTTSSQGCSPGGRPEEVIKVDAANDPLNMPRSILQRYAEGQPFGSEISSFPSMIEAVKKVDPARAEVLEKGLADLQAASPADVPAKAKELLGKLQPAMK